MVNTLGRPTTPTDTLLSRVATIASMRVNDAADPTRNGFYDIVAFDPTTGCIWVKRDGHAACRVDPRNKWRGTCPDCLTLRKLEKECRDAGKPIAGIMCKHVGHLFECIARELKGKEDAIDNYRDLLPALLAAYPDLPASWEEEEPAAAPASTPTLDIPPARVPSPKQRTADYDPFPVRNA